MLVILYSFQQIVPKFEKSCILCFGLFRKHTWVLALFVSRSDEEQSDRKTDRRDWRIEKWTGLLIDRKTDTYTRNNTQTTWARMHTIARIERAKERERKRKIPNADRCTNIFIFFELGLYKERNVIITHLLFVRLS